MTMNDVKRMTTNDKIFKDVIILKHTHNKQYRVFFQELNRRYETYFTNIEVSTCEKLIVYLLIGKLLINIILQNCVSNNK